MRPTPVSAIIFHGAPVKIGILSDTHDHLENVQAAAEFLAREGITTLLHCGDVCGPEVVQLLAGFSVYFARGNMDRMPALGRAVEASQGPGRLARCHELVLDGHRLAVVHGDEGELLHRLIGSGGYVYVIYGHTHRRTERQIGSTRVVNPGALGGIRLERRSFCTLDLRTGLLRFHELPLEAWT